MRKSLQKFIQFNFYRFTESTLLLGVAVNQVDAFG